MITLCSKLGCEKYLYILKPKINRYMRENKNKSSEILEMKGNPKQKEWVMLQSKSEYKREDVMMSFDFNINNITYVYNKEKEWVMLPSRSEYKEEDVLMSFSFDMNNVPEFTCKK